MPSSETIATDRYRLAAFGIVLYVIAVALLVGVGVSSIGWNLVYPLDDTYIHLSTARTLVEHGQWSAVPSEPSSPSSSVLWTMLLAGTGALGLLGEWTPLLLNVVFGLVAVLVLERILARRFSDLSPTHRALVLAAVILGSSLSVQTVVGMEHALQILVALLFVETALGTLLERISPDEPHQHAIAPWAVWIFAPLLVAVRFEAAFLVLPVCILLAWYRHIFTGFLLGLASMIPVGAFALYSASVGNYPLPNSILLKTSALGVTELDFFSSVLINLLDAPLAVVVVLLSLAILLAGRFRDILERSEISLVSMAAFMIGLATTLQLIFASTGWLFRYEAYLLAVAFTFLGPYSLTSLENDARSYVSARTAKIGTWVIVGILLTRVILSHFDTIRSMKDRYLEHYLPAAFVTEYFPDSPIMVNDLGLAAWHHTGKVLDIFGLGSNHPVDLRVEKGSYTREDVRQWAEREEVVVAIHKIEWTFAFDHIPQEWELICIWEVPRNVVFSDRLVAFFAVDPTASDELFNHMQTFVDERVPDSIKTKFYEPGEKHFREFIRATRGAERDGPSGR